jgi:hypothetical protein
MFKVTNVSGNELEKFLNGIGNTTYLSIFPNHTFNDYFYVVYAIKEPKLPKVVVPTKS